jgi:hypothetical protein
MADVEHATSGDDGVVIGSGQPKRPRAGGAEPVEPVGVEQEQLAGALNGDAVAAVDLGQGSPFGTPPGPRPWKVRAVKGRRARPVCCST